MLLAEHSFVTKRSKSNYLPTVSAQRSCKIEVKKAAANC